MLGKNIWTFLGRRLNGSKRFLSANPSVFAGTSSCEEKVEKISVSQSLSSFDSFPELRGDVKNALLQMGIKRPTEIQERALSSVLKGESAYISSECGSGKSLLFLLPILQRCLSLQYNRERPGYPIAFVLVPSLELAQQVKAMLINLSMAVSVNGENAKNEKKPWLTVNCLTDLEKREFMMYWELLKGLEKSARIFRKSYNHFQALVYQNESLQKAYEMIGGYDDSLAIQSEKMIERCPMVLICTPGVFLSHASENEIYEFLLRIPILVYDEMDQLLLQTGIGIKYLEMIKRLRSKDSLVKPYCVENKIDIPPMSLTVKSIIFSGKFMEGRTNLPTVQRQFLLSSATMPPLFLQSLCKPQFKNRRQSDDNSLKTIQIKNYESSRANVSLPRNQIFIDFTDDRAVISETPHSEMKKKIDEIYCLGLDTMMPSITVPIDSPDSGSSKSKKTKFPKAMDFDRDGIPYLPGITSDENSRSSYLWDKRLDKLTDILTSLTSKDQQDGKEYKTVLVFASKTDDIFKIKNTVSKSMSDLVTKKKVQIFALTKDVNEYDRMFILKPFLRSLYIPSTDVTNQACYAKRKLMKEPATLAPLNVIILTDGFSRGLDFKRVDLVIQFDFACTCIDYLHRTGRTAREGSVEGQIINFVLPEQKILATAIQNAVQRGGESLSKLDAEFAKTTRHLIKEKKYEARMKQE